MFKYYSLVIANAVGSAIGPVPEPNPGGQDETKKSSLVPLIIGSVLVCIGFLIQLVLNANVVHHANAYHVWQDRIPLGVLLWDDHSWHRELVDKYHILNLCMTFAIAIQAAGLFFIARCFSKIPQVKTARIVIAVISAIMLLSALFTNSLTSGDPYAYVAYAHLSFHNAYLPTPNMFSGPLEALNTLPDHMWFGLEPAPYGAFWLGIAHATIGMTQTLYQGLIANRILNIAAFLVCVFSLIRMHVRPVIVALFAVNPAIIFDVVADGHNDIVALACIIASFAIARKFPWLGVVVSALAGLVKLPYIVISLLTVTAFKKVTTRIFACAVLVIVVLAASYAFGGHDYFYSLTHHVTNNSSNEPRWHAALHIAIVLAACASVFAAVVFSRYFTPLTYAYPTLFAIVHPWYLLAGLPYALKCGEPFFASFLVLLPLVGFEMEIVYNPSFISNLLFVGIVISACIGIQHRFFRKNDANGDVPAAIIENQEADKSLVTSKSIIGTVAAAAVVLIIAFVKNPWFPIDDSATFEYYGNAMLHGQRLYVDIWDNKLPSIYFLNEAFQFVFPHLYKVHLAVQLLMNALAAFIVFSIMRRHARNYASITAVGFLAIISLIPRHMNTTEEYALLLALCAFNFYEQKRGFLSGLCIALASTFWLPSVIFGLWMFIRSQNRARIFYALACGLVAALGVALLSELTNGHIADLLASWRGYLHSNSDATGAKALVRRLYNSTVEAMVIPFFFGIAALTKRTFDRYEIDLIGWSVCSLLGAMASLRLYPHYFLPAVAPLAMLTASLAGRENFRTMAGWRVSVGVFACAFLALSANAARHVTADVHGFDIERQEIGGQILSQYGPSTTLETVGRYAPEVYLAAQARPTSPDGIVASAVASANQDGKYPFPSSNADVVLLYKRSRLVSIPNNYVSGISTSANWRLYVKRSLRPFGNSHS